MHHRRMLIALVCLSSFGCGVDTIIHNVSQREANRIVELLADNNIIAHTSPVEGREITFAVSVAASDRLDAIRLLNYYELPRRPEKGYNEVFKETGLIPTSAEEKAKKLAALEGEIERQLRIIDGILDVQVQLVLPEETVLRTTQEQQAPTTASVTVKYLPAAGGSKPLSEPQVQAIVAGGAEGLTPEHVVVVMTPATKISGIQPDANAAAVDNVSSLKLYRMAGAVVLVLVVLLGLGLLMSQMRLKQVHSRYSRLQEQIQRARKKATGTDAEADQAPAA